MIETKIFSTVSQSVETSERKLSSVDETVIGPKYNKTFCKATKTFKARLIEIKES